MSHQSLVHVMVFARGRGVTPCPCHPGWLLPAPDTQAVVETTSGIVPAAKQHPGIKREVLNATAHILSQFLPLQLGVVDRRSRSSKVPNPLASVLTAPSQPRGVLQPGSTPALGGPAWWPCRPGHGAGEVEVGEMQSGQEGHLGGLKWDSWGEGLGKRGEGAPGKGDRVGAHLRLTLCLPGGLRQPLSREPGGTCCPPHNPAPQQPQGM